MSIGPCLYPRCGGHADPVLTSLTICDGCRGKYWRLLRWLAEDYVVLRSQLPAPVVSGARVRSSSQVGFGHPAEWASDEARAIAVLVSQVEDALREFVSDRPASHLFGPELRLAVDGFAYLRTRFEALCTFPAAGHAAEELVERHRKIRAGLGFSRRVERLTVPCPRCNLLTLEADGSCGETIMCSQCGHRVRAGNYSLLVEVAVGVVQSQDDDLLDRYDAMTPQEREELAVAAVDAEVRP